jgi:exopolyphosphatase/guanosine-5'-triphosphate,3'-diphosphate pyrophosphatase
VSKLRVTGTSAVRDARNRDEFFDGVKALTGVNAELLSGEQEAQATFLGTLADLDEQGPVLVVDIGGGSTELITGTDVPDRLVSINIGCVRMLEKHLHSDPPTETEIDALRQEVTAELTKAKDGLDVPSGARLIGVAGTVTQLATLKAGLPVYDPDVTHHFVLSHGDVRLMAKRLGSLTYAQRKRVKGLELGRADVIIAGARILLAVMETFDAAEILVSEKDILDGLVMQLLQA